MKNFCPMILMLVLSLLMQFFYYYFICLFIYFCRDWTKIGQTSIAVIAALQNDKEDEETLMICSSLLSNVEFKSMPREYKNTVLQLSGE